MAGEETFDVLLQEFRRVGVDPDPFSALLAVRPEEALRALKALPDNAGSTAFISRLRADGNVSAEDRLATSKARTLRRRDKSA